MLTRLLLGYIFREREEIEALKKSLIFNKFTKKELKKVIPHLYRRTYAKGETIVKYGEPGFALYIISSGKVSVEVPSNEGTLVVDELTVGEFFGEMALVSDNFRSATVIAKTETCVYVMPRSALEEVVKLHPEVGAKLLLNIAKVIAERLNKVNEKLASLNDSK